MMILILSRFYSDWTISAFVVDLLVKLYVYIMSHDLYHLSHGFVCGPN